MKVLDELETHLTFARRATIDAGTVRLPISLVERLVRIARLVAARGRDGAAPVDEQLRDELAALEKERL